MSSQPVFGKRLKVWGERRGQQAQARGRVWVSHAGAGNERTAESEPQGSLSAVCLQTKFLFPPQKFCTGRSSPSSFLLQQWLQSKIRQTRSRGKKASSGQRNPRFFWLTCSCRDSPGARGGSGACSGWLPSATQARTDHGTVRVPKTWGMLFQTQPSRAHNDMPRG